MKKLIVFLLAVMTVLCLASCGGDNTPPTPPDNSEIPYTAIVYDGSINLSELSSIITKENGKMIPLKMYSGESSGIEIVIGDTDRAVTAEAKEVMGALLDDQKKESFGYVVYKDKAGNVAVVWSNATYMTEPAIARFTESFVDLVTLSERQYGVLASEFFEIDAYIEEAAWAEIKATATPEVYAALKKLNSFIDGSAIANWMAQLYDPYICVCGKCAEEGKEIACYGAGFYYSNSGRDYDGFLPDAESTVQLLRWFANNGAFENYGADIGKAIPESIKAKLLQYGQALQDPGDGYFYHPQWGKDISISRKGRDLGWGKNLISYMGGKPLYKLPTDSPSVDLEATAHLTAPLGASVVMPVDASTDAFEAALKSEATYLEWLYANTDDIKTNSEGSHAIASAWSQIKAAGYAEVTYEYYDRIQTEVYEEMKAKYLADPENNPEPSGVFQYNADYKAVWGVLKLYSIFSDTGSDYKYHAEKIKTCIKVIQIDADADGVKYAANDIYNMWKSIDLVINNAKKHHPDIVPSLYKLLEDGTAEMIDNSINKLVKFKRDDGGFSISVNENQTAMYGSPVAMGVMESDVNGTALICSMYRFIFECLGYTPVPLCDFRDGEMFLDIILNAPPIEKIPRATDGPQTFDEMPGDSQMEQIFDGAEVEIVTDPKNPANTVLAYKSTPGESKGDSLRFPAFVSNPEATCWILSFDMMIDSASAKPHYQITMANKNSKSYMIEILSKDDKLTIAENVTTSSSSRNYLDVTINTDEWFNVRIEYYADDTKPAIKLYYNDKLILVSGAYFSSNTKPPYNVFDFGNFFALKATNATVYLDNVYAAKVMKEYVEESVEP